MSNNTQDECPELPVEWPLGAWPEANQTVGLLIFCVTAFLFVWGLQFMFRNRHINAYKSRNVALITISSVGILAQVAQLSLREYVGRENWPCDAIMWCNYMAIGLWLGPMAVQLLQLRNRLRWQDKLQKMPLHLPNTSAYVAIKYKAGNKRAYLSLVFVLFVMSTTTLAYAFSKPQYLSGCFGCFMNDTDFIVYAAIIFILVAFIVVATKLVPKPPKGQRPHPLVQQLRVHIRFHVPIFFLYVVLNLLDPWDAGLEGFFSWNHVASLALVQILFYTTAWPGLFVRWQKQKPKVRLAHVLRDPVLLELFENHLKTEFSLENLRFYFEATELKRKFPTTEDPAALMAWRKRALDVYNTFVSPEGLLSLNLSANIRRSIHAHFTPSTSNVRESQKQEWIRNEVNKNEDIQEDVFDKAIREVYKLMETDSYARFADYHKELLKDNDMTLTHESSVESNGGGQLNSSTGASTSSLGHFFNKTLSNFGTRKGKDADDALVPTQE